MKRLMLALLAAAVLQLVAARAAEAPDAEAIYQAMRAANPAATDWRALRFGSCRSAVLANRASMPSS